MYPCHISLTGVSWNTCIKPSIICQLYDEIMEAIEQFLKNIREPTRDPRRLIKEKLKEAYGQIFDIIDHDKSGHIDGCEFSNWLGMVGAEVDMKELKESLLGDEKSEHPKLTRNRFTDFMSKKAKQHLRHYELGSVQE